MIKLGIIFLFYDVGAYSVVFNISFHHQTEPAIVIKISKGNLKIIRKGTSYKELFKEEKESLG
jgi:diaminopimelate decarboxylase